MLVIRDAAELVKYLEARLEMANGQVRTAFGRAETSYARGMCFGFEQALQAAKALMESGVRENSENNPDSAKETNPADVY